MQTKLAGEKFKLPSKGKPMKEYENLQKDEVKNADSADGFFGKLESLYKTAC